MPAGSILKVSLMYDEPFWRTDGLNGQSLATTSPIEMTLDASPRSGVPGVLAAFGFGPYARPLGALDPDERRRLVLDALVTRFGARAAHPAQCEQIDWAEERWTRGASWRTCLRGSSPSSGARCGRPSAASTGPGARQRPCRTGAS